MTLEEKLDIMFDGEIQLHISSQDIFNKFKRRIPRIAFKSPSFNKEIYVCVNYFGEASVGDYRFSKLPIVEITEDDFKDTQETTQPSTTISELQQQILDITKDIKTIQQLEDKYETDVDFSTLVDIRDELLEKLGELA